MTTTLTWHRGDGWHLGDYYAQVDDDHFYAVSKVQESVLGRFGGGTTYNFWKAEFVTVHRDGNSVKYNEVRLLVSLTNYDPTFFKSDSTFTKKLAVIACQAHADGADNERKK